MHDTVSISDLITLAQEVIASARQHDRTTTVSAQPLRESATDRNLLAKQDFEGLRLDGWEEVYLLLTDDETPTVAVRSGYFWRRLKQRSLEWYATYVIEERGTIARHVGDFDVTPYQQGAISNIAQHLSDLLPAGHPLKRSYLRSFV